MGSGTNKAANAAEIDRLALALAKEPGSKAFIPLAEEYGKAGMWEEAAAVLEDGLKSYPNFITAMVTLGRAYDQMNQPLKATAILEEAVKLSPENLRAHRTLAKIYAAQGMKEATLRSCRVILAVNPQDQEALSLCTMLGIAAELPSAGQPKSASAGATGPVRTETGAVAGKAVTPRHAGPSEEEHPPASLDKPADPLDKKSVTVAQLEQWLTSIQQHRRDQGAAPDQDS